MRAVNDVSVLDRLKDENDRRYKGDFYTPLKWVREGVKYIDADLGVDWRDKYVVWDCACGTKNLTRAYSFAELYSSTLNQEDLDVSADLNVDGCSFQYDFLNDDVDAFDDVLELYRGTDERPTVLDFKDTILYKKAPKLIKSLCAGKPLLFYINPPYSAAGGIRKEVKKGVSGTEIKKLMIRDGVGSSAQDLSTQFLYRIFALRELFKIDVKIGLYAPLKYISGKSNKKLRDYMRHKGLGISSAFLFNAGEFSDCTSSWAVSFCILQDGYSIDDVTADVLKRKRRGEEIKKVGEHLLYNTDSRLSLLEWANVDGVREDAPQLTSALKYAKCQNRGYLLENALAATLFKGNYVSEGVQNCCILSSCFKSGGAVSITAENFVRSVVAFTARALMGSCSSWVNGRDEFLAPLEGSSKYKQFARDSVVYSLFTPKSQQSSLRGIDYNAKSGKFWRHLYNQFFYVKRDDLLSYIDTMDSCPLCVLNDLKDSSVDQAERYVTGLLDFIYNDLSPDARAVLDKARELTLLSLKYRDDFNKNHPEYHIGAWDAGWYQVRGLLKEYAPEALKEFTELFKAFEERLHPLVYDLGFLLNK